MKYRDSLYKIQTTFQKAFFSFELFFKLKLGTETFFAQVKKDLNLVRNKPCVFK